MSLDRLIRGSLLGYVGIALGFIFVPIVISFIFSFNEGRFPILPIENFSTVWYEAIWNEAPVPRAFRFSIIVGLSVAAISTFIGFATAYTDFPLPLPRQERLPRPGTVAAHDPGADPRARHADVLGPSESGR